MFLTCIVCAVAATWVGSMWMLRMRIKNTKLVSHFLLSLKKLFLNLNGASIPLIFLPGKSVLEMAKLEKITRQIEL